MILLYYVYNSKSTYLLIIYQSPRGKPCMISDTLSIGHVNQYRGMHYFGIPRHTKSMIAYKILTKYF